MLCVILVKDHQQITCDKITKAHMFIDWLSVSQEHDHDLPVVCDVYTLTIDAHSHEVLTSRQPRFKHEGSFSSSIVISVQGRKVRVDGTRLASTAWTTCSASRPLVSASPFTTCSW